MTNQKGVILSLLFRALFAFQSQENIAMKKESHALHIQGHSAILERVPTASGNEHVIEED